MFTTIGAGTGIGSYPIYDLLAGKQGNTACFTLKINWSGGSGMGDVETTADDEIIDAGDDSDPEL